MKASNFTSGLVFLIKQYYEMLSYNTRESFKKLGYLKFEFQACYESLAKKVEFVKEDSLISESIAISEEECITPQEQRMSKR